ncbi:MAG: protein kinase [Planctomycetes bacterium]|nr:protein kinase [Planctomycetota bacterium]
MLLGGYEVLGEIARGAYGVVYRARDPRVGREVAIKVLSHIREPDEVERFLREGQAAARVSHPNVIKVHTAGHEGGRPYLVMDLVKGPTLRARLAKEGPLDEDEAVVLLRQVASAVQAAHEAGVLHRDLKPENVLLEDGRPLLADFGLARLEDARTLTQTGQLLGTPAYMAPEQVEGDRGRLGPATDVYGLGGLLYACLTGHPPFRGDSVLATFDMVLRQPLEPPSALRPGLNLGLEAICLRCLERDSKKRYASAAALIDALETWEEPTVRPERSQGGFVIALFACGAAVALGALVAVGLGLAWFASEASPRPLTPTPVASPAPSRMSPTPTPSTRKRGVKARAQARELLGRARSELPQSLELARVTLELALQADDSLQAARLELALVHVRRHELRIAEELLARVDFDRPEAEGEGAARAHFVRGRLLYERGLKGAAFEEFRRAVESGTSRASHVAWLGMSSRPLDPSFLPRANGLDSQDPAVVLFKTICRVDRGFEHWSIKSALADVEEALDRAPANPRLSAQLVFLRFESGDRQVALREARAFGVRWPAHPIFPYMLSRFCQALARGPSVEGREAWLARAEKALTAGLRFAPSDRLLKIEHAWLLSWVGRHREAVAEFDSLAEGSAEGLVLGKAYFVTARWFEFASRTRDTRGLGDVLARGARSDRYLVRLEERFPGYLRQTSFGGTPEAVAASRSRFWVLVARVLAIQRRWEDAEKIFARELRGGALDRFIRRHRLLSVAERFRHELWPAPARAERHQIELARAAKSRHGPSTFDAAWIAAAGTPPVRLQIHPVSAEVLLAAHGDQKELLALTLLRTPRSALDVTSAWSGLAEAEPSNLLARVGLVEALVVAGELDAALAACGEAPPPLQSEPLLIAVRARALTLRGAKADLKEAKQILDEVLEVAPRCAVVLVARIETSLRQGRGEQAKADLEQLRAKAPQEWFEERWKRAESLSKPGK